MWDSDEYKNLYLKYISECKNIIDENQIMKYTRYYSYYLRIKIKEDYDYENEKKKVFKKMNKFYKIDNLYYIMVFLRIVRLYLDRKNISKSEEDLQTLIKEINRKIDILEEH